MHRRMGSNTTGSKINGDNRPNRATRIYRWLAADPSRRARLRDSLGVFVLRLNDYKNRGLGTATWIQACDDSVKAIDQAIADNELDRGWAFLHEGERLEIDGLDGATLRARAIAVRFEAEAKLNGWRKESSVKILDTAASNPGGEKGDKDRAFREVGLRNELKEALRLRDEHFFNVYRKSALQSELLVLTAVILALVLATLVSLASDNPSGVLGTPDDLLRAMMYGALGALISTAVSLAEDTMGKKRIPEHLATIYATLARPFFGASFGVAAYIAIRSGVVSIFAGKPDAIALACVLAGFSERWFLGIFDSAIAKKAS